ncbi:hypothetical protein PG997_012196 [Apiospora hydei]|uniref:Secreted protein n=1 Tax=Apiospora hydei TaxID=1337664 RepID=A0ABR1V5X7_9PEZI
MHRHGVLAILLFGVHGTFAASSCYFDTCLKRVNCGEGCVADCARHLAVTVTPPGVTITIDVQLAAGVTPIAPASTLVNAAPDCEKVAGFPYWAALTHEYGLLSKHIGRFSFGNLALNATRRAKQRYYPNNGVRDDRKRARAPNRRTQHTRTTKQWQEGLQERRKK